jgi:hypothetical protein
MAGPAFLEFWRNEHTRDNLLDKLERSDIQNLRLSCHGFSVRCAPSLFKDVQVTFKASTFTKPARMAALTRIGRHIRKFNFCMNHTSETFLPPLLDPLTGEERTFHYVPQIHIPQGRKKHRRYGSREMSDMLINQYGPIFHAASNVPAFVRAFGEMPKLEHLVVSCPGQTPSQRYRRSAVDYALISLRLAIETNALVRLKTLSLTPVHPAALLYLSPSIGIGSSPSSTRTWKKIVNLHITLESWEFRSASPDHLKHLHEYLLNFSPSLENLTFLWKGPKGPCPFTLDTDHLVDPDAAVSSKNRKLRKMRLRRLKNMQLRNSRLHARQIDTFLRRHKSTIADIDFEEVELITGDWDEALAQLTVLTGSDSWKEENTDTSMSSSQESVPSTVRSMDSMESMTTSASSHTSMSSISSAAEPILDAYVLPAPSRAVAYLESEKRSSSVFDFAIARTSEPGRLVFGMPEEMQHYWNL